MSFAFADPHAFTDDGCVTNGELYGLTHPIRDSKSYGLTKCIRDDESFTDSIAYGESFTMSITNWSGTNAPVPMMDLALIPSGVCPATFSRSRSPVEICGMPKVLEISLACVPLPAPGAPSRIIGPTMRSFAIELTADVGAVMFDLASRTAALSARVPGRSLPVAPKISS